MPELRGDGGLHKERPREKVVSSEWLDRDGQTGHCRNRAMRPEVRGKQIIIRRTGTGSGQDKGRGRGLTREGRSASAWGPKAQEAEGRPGLERMSEQGCACNDST